MFLREDEEITTTDTWTNAQVMKVVTIDWALLHFLYLGSCLSQYPAASVASGSQGLITQEVYIPDFFDEEFDQRYDVPGLWNCVSPNCLADFILLICIMCIVQNACIHHIGMPDILAQFIRALEVSFHWKPTVSTAATLHHWLQRISFWPEFVAKHIDFP